MNIDQICKSWRTWCSTQDALYFKAIARYWNLSLRELFAKIIYNAKSQIFVGELDKEQLKYQLKWFLDACEHDPLKTVCPLCLNLNLSYDDVGYFYSNEHISRIKSKIWIDPLDKQPESPYIPNCCEPHHTAER